MGEAEQKVWAQATHNQVTAYLFESQFILLICNLIILCANTESIWYFRMDKDCEEYLYSTRTKRRRVKATVDNHLREMEQNLCSLEVEVDDECPDVMASIANVRELMIEHPHWELPLSQPDSSEQATNESCVAAFASPAESHSINFITMNNNTNTIETDDKSFVDSSSYDSSCSDDEQYPLRSELAEWAGIFNISHTALSGLLSILQKAGVDVPKDPRTLLATPKHTDIRAIAGGSYHYFGVVNVVRQKLSLFSECKRNKFSYSISILMGSLCPIVHLSTYGQY